MKKIFKYLNLKFLSKNFSWKWDLKRIGVAKKQPVKKVDIFIFYIISFD